MSESTRPVRIVVADDQALVRRGLRLILEAEPDLDVVGEAGDGVEALAVVAQVDPDVVLVDLRMPQMDGVEAIRRMPTGVRSLVLTTFGGDSQIYAALKAGASGYLLKTAPPETLVGAIRTVAAGDALLDPRITRRLIEEYVARPSPEQHHATLAQLTEREAEVLRLVARGLSNSEIAAKAFLSEATVKTYLGRVLAKTASRDRAQLVVLAFETGLVRPGEPSRNT